MTSTVTKAQLNVMISTKVLDLLEYNIDILRPEQPRTRKDRGPVRKAMCLFVEEALREKAEREIKASKKTRK